MPYEKSCSTKEAAQVFLKISQNPQENTFARVSFLTKLQEVCNFIKKETLAQVFFSEFCEIFKNIFFIEHLLVTASDYFYSKFEKIQNICKWICELTI